jgi:hypothetical protein
MNVIEQIKQKLKKYPEIRLKHIDNTLETFPEGGFKVWITEWEQNCTVGYGAWHEEFSNKNDALEYFVFGLSCECRLKVYKKANFEYKWIAQQLNNECWYNISTTGMLFFPFWCKTKVQYLQNNIFSFTLDGETRLPHLDSYGV